MEGFVKEIASLLEEPGIYCFFFLRAWGNFWLFLWFGFSSISTLCTAMSIPKPPINLDGHCSVLHDDVLYVFTPEAFLSLPLKRDAEWSKLPMGVSVVGAACTKGAVGGDPKNQAFYVVGGTSDKADYRGLQRFSFVDKKWEPVSTVTQDIKNRVKHDAIYIPSEASILVYAGTTNGDPNPSTQTFLIGLDPPYNVRSFNSYVPPAIYPTLLPWGNDSAVMLGGSPGNTKVYAFTNNAWKDTGATLAKPFPEEPQAKAAMVIGDDGSRILEIFDLGQSPNTVSRHVLLRADGTPAPANEEVGAANPKKSSRRRKRGVSISDYPGYDNSNAPTTKRSQSSLAQDGNGKVVISGGSDDEPLSIFDQSSNSWVDTQQLFVGEKPDSVSSSTTSSSSTSSSSTTSSDSPTSSVASNPAATTSSLPPPASGSHSGSNKNTIIGAVLGSVLGFAAILIVILLLLRSKKRKQTKGKAAYGDDKDRLSFQDQGMEPLTKSIQPMGRGPVPSTDSVAIVSGRINEKSFEHLTATTSAGTSAAADPEKEKGRSPLRNVETAQPDNNNTRNLTGAPANASRGDRRTDEGWSKYFQDDTDPQLLRGDSMRSDASSRYTKTDDKWPRGTEVEPLDISRLAGESHPLGRVPSGSPSTEHAPKLGESSAVHQGLTAKISSGDSISIASDDNDDRTDAESLTDRPPWAPMSAYVNSKHVSSNYSDSLYPSGPPVSAQRGLFVPGGADRPTSTMTQWPSTNAETHDETRTNISSDVSWLNLGNNR